MRLPLDLDTGPLEGRTLAGDEPILRIDHQAVGGVRVLAVDGEVAIGAQLHDPLVDDVGEVDVAGAVGCWAFGEGDSRSDFWRLIGCLGGKRGNSGANKGNGQARETGHDSLLLADAGKVILSRCPAI